MTDSKITPFLFEGEITVRVIDRDDTPWFVVADVCRALGLSNPAEVVRGLDDDEKGISMTDTFRGNQEVVVVSESGLYALIFRSRKPNAVRFRKWVTSEVLPAIRKHGMYSLPMNPIPPGRKDWADWTPEEIRCRLAQVNTARQVFGKGGAAWMWDHLGFPVPPRHLLPAWWQLEIYIPQDVTTS